MVTVFHYTAVNAKQFDGLNIDGLAGKRQKRQNTPRQNFALHGIYFCEFLCFTKLCYTALHSRICITVPSQITMNTLLFQVHSTS